MFFYFLGEKKITIIYVIFKPTTYRGAWVAQSVGRPTTAQVMISRSVNSSPASGSVLAARSLEPASDSVSPSLSLPLPCSLSVSKINKHEKNVLKGKGIICIHISEIYLLVYEI